MKHPFRHSGLLLFCLLGIALRLSAQNGFIRSIPLNPFHADVQPVPATGGYLLASRFYDSIVPTMVFMELDSACRTQAIHGYASTSELELIQMIPLTGGNFAGVGGGTDSLGSAAFSLLVSAQGQVSQARLLQRAYFSGWWDGTAMPDGGFVAVGTMNDFQEDYSLIARFNAQGDTLWTRIIHIAGELLEFTGVTAVPGGDLMVVGNYYDGQSNANDAMLVRFSPAGDLRWARRCPTNRSMYASDILASGTKLFVSINTENLSSGDYSSGMVAFDTAATASWATELGGFADAGTRTLRLTPSGNPLLLGYYDTSVGYNAHLAALDGSTGGLLWARGYDLNGEADLLQALPLSGGRYLLLAEEYASSDPIHLIATMQDGIVPGPCNSVVPNFQPTPLTFTTVPLAVTVQRGMSVNTPVLTPVVPVVDNILNCEPVAVDPARAQVPVQVLPHPMQTSARVVLPADLDWTGAVIQVTDMGGRSVDMAATPTREGFELHRNGLPAGLYAYQVLQGGLRVAAGKLVLQDGF